MSWIILANGNMYRIYNYEESHRELTLLKEMQHPESKEKISDLMTDKPGHYKTREGSRGSFSPHSDPHENEIDAFLQTLAKEIETGRVTNQYNDIILIAPSHINGMLSKHINKHTKVSGQILKDYTNFTQKELLNYLRDEWLDIVKRD